jgi:opacity protein-like surface antigen
MKTLRSVSVLSLLLYQFLLTSGQVNLIPKYEVGIVGGLFVYQGDLTPSAAGDFKTSRPGFGIFATRNINRNLAIRFQLLRGGLKGDDAKYDNPAWRQQRNFNFKSPVTELSGSFVWHLLGLQANEAGIINFSPYFFGGLGYSFLKIKRDYSSFNYTHFAGETGVLTGLAEDVNHKLPKGIFEFPVGAGVRYGINEKLSFNLEGTYRLTSTDYLDGFSQAANPARNDHFHTLTVGLIYSFGKRNKWDCPKIRN